MVEYLVNLLEICNREVKFFQQGLQTEEELKKSTEELLRFYLRKVRGKSKEKIK